MNRNVPAPQLRSMAQRSSADSVRRMLDQCPADGEVLLLALSRNASESMRTAWTKRILLRHETCDRQPVLMTTEQLIDAPKILEHLDMLIVKGFELQLISGHHVLGLGKPPLQVLEDLQAQFFVAL